MLAEVEACRQADSRELFGAQQALLQLGGPACVEGLQAIPRERFQTLMTEMERQGQQVRQSFLGEEVVAALLAAGADARAPNAEGSTPLHWAALNGHAGVARQLLAAGSSATALNKHDRTPLDEALGGGHEDVRAALAEAVPKADIPEQDKTLDNEGNPLAGVEEGGEGDDSMET